MFKGTGTIGGSFGVKGVGQVGKVWGEGVGWGRGGRGCAAAQADHRVKLNFPRQWGEREILS